MACPQSRGLDDTWVISSPLLSQGHVLPSPRRWRYVVAPQRSSHSPVKVIVQFDTKIAVVIRTDLEAWQKLNVAAFLAGGIAAGFPECIGEPYQDGSGTNYLSLIGQPILIYG